MCVIIVSEKVPPMDILELAAKKNPDGVGMALYLGRGNWMIRRALSFKEFNMGGLKDGTQIWHFRLASAGSIHLRNVQPIAIPPSCAKEEVVKSWIAHNGHISGLSSVSDLESDTRKLAKILHANVKPGLKPWTSVVKMLSGRFVVAYREKYMMVGNFIREKDLWLSASLKDTQGVVVYRSMPTLRRNEETVVNIDLENGEECVWKLPGDDDWQKDIPFWLRKQWKGS